MKRLLVTGSSGMLGGNIVSGLKDSYEIFGIDKNNPNPELRDQFKIDLTDKRACIKVAGEIKPDLVVHCAALTNVDTCETDYRLANSVNAVATSNIARAAGPRARFCYISTDSVFDGNRGNYRESDTPAPVNNYAKTKLEGEAAVRRSCDNHVIIRLNMFGWNRVGGLSFAEWVIENLSAKRPIKMFEDVIFSPLLASTISSFIDKLFNLSFIGVLHIGSSSAINKYDFGIRLAGLFGLDASLISPARVDDFGFKAQRPKNTSLDVSKANKILGNMPTVEEELKKFYDTRRISL